MNLTQLQKAQTIYLRIQEIDKDILTLDKAVQEFTGKLKLTLSMEEKSCDSRPDVFDEHGFIKDEFKGGSKSTASSFPLEAFDWLRMPIMNTPKTSIDLSKYISDTTAYEIFAILFRDLQTSRMALLKDLEKLGVTL